MFFLPEAFMPVSCGSHDARTYFDLAELRQISAERHGARLLE